MGERDQIKAGEVRKIKEEELKIHEQLEEDLQVAQKKVEK